MVPADVDSQESVSSALKEVQSIVGNDGLSCLINNAAIGITADLRTVSPEAMMTSFRINTVAPLFVTKVGGTILRTEITAARHEPLPEL